MLSDEILTATTSRCILGVKARVGGLKDKKTGHLTEFILCVCERARMCEDIGYKHSHVLATKKASRTDLQTACVQHKLPKNCCCCRL